MADGQLFRVPGDNNLAEFNYYLTKSMSRDAFKCSPCNRGTDDRRLDPERKACKGTSASSDLG